MNLMLVHTHVYTCTCAQGVFSFFNVQNVLVLKQQITFRVITDHQQKVFQSN